MVAPSPPSNALNHLACRDSRSDRKLVSVPWVSTTVEHRSSHYEEGRGAHQTSWAWQVFAAESNSGEDCGQSKERCESVRGTSRLVKYRQARRRR